MTELLAIFGFVWTENVRSKISHSLNNKVGAIRNRHENVQSEITIGPETVSQKAVKTVPAG